jgi:hypothetical protein
MPWELTVLTLPELDEAEDFFGLLTLAQIGVGVAKGATAGVLLLCPSQFRACGRLMSPGLFGRS